MSHTNRLKKLFKVTRNVEPGIINVFDFNIQMETSQVSEGYMKKSYRVLSMKDDEFVFDYVTQDEKFE